MNAARALNALLAWNGDARAEARRAVEAEPDKASGHLLEAYLFLCSRHPGDMVLARAALGRALALPLDARERLHAGTIATSLGRDYDRARDLLGALLVHFPRDLMALAVVHTLDYYLGDVQALRARPGAALAHWPKEDPAYAGLLAMHAFGLEESGDYARAESAALAALALDPTNLRALHARAHVLEMQGRTAEGVRWMEEQSARWDVAGATSAHLRWHLALYRIALGDLRGALADCDRIAAGDSLSAMIDTSALLWRLGLRGVDLGTRWADLAGRWAPRAEDAFCAFNDLHAMLAFVGAGRRDQQRRLLQAQRRRIAGAQGTNVGMLLDVGHPACRALQAWGREDYAQAEELLRGLPAVSHRIGGSHAQRGLIGLTLREAEKRIRGRSPISSLTSIRALTPISRLPAAHAT